MIKLCIIKGCVKTRAHRGLCLTCYNQARHKVEIGETTWEKLEQMGLCKLESNPFDDAYSQAMQEGKEAGTTTPDS